MLPGRGARGLETGQEKKDTSNKSLKESQKREDELVTLAAAVKENQEKRAERKGEVLKSYEVRLSREIGALQGRGAQG